VAGCILIGIWLVLLALLVRDEAMESRAETPAVRSKPELRAEARREWMEIYVAEKKVGYAVTRVSPAGEGYAVTEETFLKLNLLGRPSALRTTLQALVDSDFRLRRFRFAMVSGAVRYHLRGRVSKGTLYLEQGEGGKGAVRKLKLDVPPMIGAGLGPYLEERGLRVGDEMSLPLFDPSTLSRNSMRVRVVGRERIRIHRIDYDAFRLEARMWGRTMTLWVDEKGSILKQEGLMGMTLVRSSAANAPRGITSGGDDLPAGPAVLSQAETGRRGPGIAGSFGPGERKAAAGRGRAGGQAGKGDPQGILRLALQRRLRRNEGLPGTGAER